MKTINSRDLFDYINGYVDNKEVKFKVFHNGNYVTDIFWDGENFNWVSGTFSSGAFFDPLYNFYLIEEDKEIEKLENKIEFYSYSKYEELKNDVDKVLYILKAINLVENKISNLNNKINELIDKVNKLERGNE